MEFTLNTSTGHQMKLVGSEDAVAPEATAVMASVLGVAVANPAPVPAPAINLG